MAWLEEVVNATTPVSLWASLISSAGNGNGTAEGKTVSFSGGKCAVQTHVLCGNPPGHCLVWCGVWSPSALPAGETGCVVDVISHVSWGPLIGSSGGPTLSRSGRQSSSRQEGEGRKLMLISHYQDYSSRDGQQRGGKLSIFNILR